MEGACSRAVLCLPDFLRWIVAPGRILVLLALHPVHAGRFREHCGLAAAENVERV